MKTYQALFIRQFCKSSPEHRLGALVFRLVFNGLIAHPAGVNKVFVVTLLPVDHPTGITAVLEDACEAIGEPEKDYDILIPILDVPCAIIDQAIELWKAREECRDTFSSMSNFCFREYRDAGYSKVSPKDVQLTISSGSAGKERVKS